ncbi:MAG TPA: ATP-binding protein [Acidobacteriaceae bacterium]|jgi:predicted ATPase|nr:ATP-binding protein [Acidobacteriaceae bacterium]
MLTRVYIDNFRSFVNFEYRPERKQLLLGPNGSGKSSLLTAIRYLKTFVKGESNEFTQSTRTRWQDRPVQVIEIEAILGGRTFEYRVEVTFADETREQSVNLERLKVAGATVFELAEGQIRFFPNESGSMAVPLQTNRSALHLSLLSNSDVRRFVEWLDRVHCISVDAYPGTMDEVADKEEREPDFELDNLAGWYRHLIQAHPDENVRFIASLKECMSGFQTLRFSTEEDGSRKLRAEFLGPMKKRISYSLSELSEGQRQLIALYMILHFLICHGETVFFDEPDNFISLREIQPWLLAAEEAVDDHQGQLILVSHHPETLNQWAKEYGLRFFREENGQVRAKKFESEPDGRLPPSEIIARGWE